MLSKGNFTRDEWNHLLRLFNIMIFSMFSCSHFSNFLFDPIRKQSAMSNRGQEGTSEESSPMAKSRSMKSAIAKPSFMSLVSHAKPEPMIPAYGKPIWCCTTRWVRGRNLPQDLRDPVNPGNVDEEGGGQTSSGKPVRTNQSQDPIEYLKWGDRKTLNMQTPGNRETGMNLRTRLDQGNLCGLWTQRQSFRTWGS